MWRKLINGLLRILYFLLLKLEVTGRENVPRGGPLILMINHVDALDPFIVVGVFPRPVTAMAKIEVLSIPLIGFLARRYGVFPIRRGQVDTGAMRQALGLLEDEGVLLVAPEGTRSPTFSLQQGKEGMALLATRTGSSIIPVAVTGTERVGHYWRQLRRAPVRIVIGQPFRLNPGTEQVTRSLLRAMTDEAMFRLADILPPAYRGVYGDPGQTRRSHLIVPPFSRSRFRRQAID